jgi:replication initiation and membrane attachment protein DnaB
MSASNRDEADWWILENPKVVSNWLLSSVEVVQKRMNIKKWEFDGKDMDEINNMKDFRKNVTRDINSRSTDTRQVAFVLDKFFNRFGIDDQQVYEWILTADYYNKNRWSFSLPYKGIELNMWNIW